MENLLNITEILNNFITPLGIILAGLWAYRKFNVRNEGQWNANLKVCTEIIKTKIGDNLVAVNITIDNIGFKKITPTINGLNVRLFKARTEMPDYCIIDDWIEIDEINKDILKVYKDENEDYTKLWNLDSGAAYNEKVLIRIKDKGLFRIKCKFHIIDKKMPDKENWLTEYDYFVL